MIQTQTSESYVPTQTKCLPKKEDNIERNWFEIELKKEALNVLLNNSMYNDKTLEIIRTCFCFKSNLTYENNIYAITQNLEKNLNRQLSEKIITEFEKNIEEINNIKYGSSSFYKKHNEEREYASQEPWSYHFGRLLSQKGLKEGYKVLDVGINDGEEIAYFPFKTTGIDLSIKAITTAQSKFPNLELIVGNANELPFKDSLFDAYISLRTLCISGVHESKAIKEAYRVLKKDGLLTVSFPNLMYDKGGILEVSKYNLDKCEPAELVKKAKDCYKLVEDHFKELSCYKNGVEDFICAKKIE